jgi:ATP-binding cassette subfamily A (ABC1) protein 3
MGDQIAILASPGKVVANGSPVALKRDLGQGYSVQVTTSPEYHPADASHGLLANVKAIVPEAYEVSTSPTQFCYHLRTRDPDVMQRVLELFDTEIRDNNIVSYAIFGTTIEEIFLDLMSKHDHVTSDADEEIVPEIAAATPVAAALADLPMGRPISPLQQAFTIFHKRLLVTKRSLFTFIITMVIAICGACVPLVFMSKSWPSCNKEYVYPRTVPLFLPNFLSYYSQYRSFLPPNIGLQSPPGILQTLGATDILKFTSAPDNASFTSIINNHYKDFAFGGISIDNTTGASLVAWEATPPGFKGLSALNLATNVLFNRALNMSGSTPDAPRLISVNYQRFPFLFDEGIVGSLRWMFYFGASMVSFNIIPCYARINLNMVVI